MRNLIWVILVALSFVLLDSGCGSKTSSTQPTENSNPGDQGGSKRKPGEHKKLVPP